MKKNLYFLFLFLSHFCFSQNEEAVYLQLEHDRLARVNNHEVAIQNYINQNINSYVLPSFKMSEITSRTDEEGDLLIGTELNAAILDAKKQNLREQFFTQNPTITNDYLATPLTLATACANNGFENGDISGFSFFSQRFNPWVIYNNFPTTSVPPSTTGIISLVDNSQMDPIISLLPRVKSGSNAIRLNNSSDGNYDVSSMRREVIVGVDQDNITFNYALVFEDPEHGENLNPYYQCRLKTANGDIIFERRIVANRNNTDVFNTINGGSIVYTNWNCENIDVSQYHNQTLILEVIIADCGWGGHWGYAYFDNFCGTKCTAPTFGQVVLDPMGITCPLLPLNVSGSFITPAGYELYSLTLQVKDLTTNTTAYLPNPYTLFGNEFNFKVKGEDLFPSGPESKQFDFFVTAYFKLIGVYSPSMNISSQSANQGPDVIFNDTCQICNACATPSQNFWYQGRYGAGDTTYNPEVNSWVDYLNTSGNTVRQIIGPIENGCQKIVAVSIVQTSGVQSCDQ